MVVRRPKTKTVLQRVDIDFNAWLQARSRETNMSIPDVTRVYLQQIRDNPHPTIKVLKKNKKRNYAVIEWNFDMLK